MGSLLYVLLCSGYIAQLVSAENLHNGSNPSYCKLVIFAAGNSKGISPLQQRQRFLVTAPSVFHVGVKERVSVQVGEGLLNKPVTCHLEQEVKSIVMSNKETIRISNEGEVGTLKLQILPDQIANLPSAGTQPPYLNLVCKVGNDEKKITRVLVSQHRGYIFIQTDQPMYNPTQIVRYRIFTLDHTMRPVAQMIIVYIINADGNVIKKMLVSSKEGIYEKDFHIPDVSQPGVWKIKAHYEGDDKNVTVREFKVQKFVLPSFGVTIKPRTDHLLVNTENFTFLIDVSYSYGKKINGGFHCRFGLREDNRKDGPNGIKFIKGIEKTGPVRNGEAEITLKITDVQEKLVKQENLQLEDLVEDGHVLFYIAVTVTDTLSGEVQETEILLPIVSQRYKVDLERTRSHYIPKVPFEVKVVVRTPNGMPAKGVPVTLKVSHTKENSQTVNTDDEGVACSVFNLEQSLQSISVEATVDGFTSTKNVAIATSSNNNFLHISVSNKVLSQGEQLSVTFNAVNGKPSRGYVYYLVLSKGVFRMGGSVQIGHTATLSLNLRPDMMPSFRLIGYYYDDTNEIIADSIWVDVKDQCEGKLEVTEKETNVVSYDPAQMVALNIDVGDQANAQVALLAVDKAIYALNAQNKLTPKQVFSSMQSYDLGCSYGGGVDTAAVFNDAGLNFISNSQVKSKMRKEFSCESGFRKQRRSIDLQKELAQKETEFPDAVLRKCCHNGLILLPMKLSCEERKKRMSASSECEEAFLKCCNFATKLREKKRKEELRSGYGRTSGSSDIENLFDNDVQYIRRSFPPSFSFEVTRVNGKAIKKIILPDSITTWEIQAVSISPSHGICVAKPIDIRAFKELFISLRLPHSVRKNEQIAIVAVIYNYAKKEQQLAVKMKQVDGLCSPGSSSSNSHVPITVAGGSSETVTFTSVPLKDGEIPITIQLYDTEFQLGVDAIQKTLLVMNEGVRTQEEVTKLINLDGRSTTSFNIDGVFPNGTIPDSDGNIFVKVEDEVFGIAAATPLLTPTSVKQLIKAPHGCAEQTMIRMSPTALAIRYLDTNNQWLELEPEMRDNALGFIEQAYDRILTYRKPDGSYGAWLNYPTSNWLTALVVKVLSLVSECQLATSENREIVSQLEIRKSANYLIKQQHGDGSFSDPNPVIHREMQGGIGGFEQDASLTAFIAIALNRSLPFLDQETESVRGSISKAAAYLRNRVDELQRPFSLAITTYFLSTLPEDKTVALSAWERLKLMAIKEENCKVWRDSEDMRLLGEKKQYLVPSSVALAVETTAYALLAALEHHDFEEAKMAVCFLSSKENYGGGFKSTQDTITALEALAEYALRLPPVPLNDLNVQFTTQMRNEKESLSLTRKGEKVETDLKRLIGSDITAKFSGKGQAKVKVVKVYYIPDSSSHCTQLSINVTVIGKVDYTDPITEAYDYVDNYDDQDKRDEVEDFPRSAIEWFDARTRRRRDTEQSQNSDNKVKYHVCVSHSLERNLTGMAIADITLLSGFEPNTEDLDLLKDTEASYISHYEVANGRVLLYFNKIYDGQECIAFEAAQRVPIGLLQPAPATFYDYYEPERRCTVFYAAPNRSKMVSALCSEDVCQCAENPCFKEKQTSELLRISKEDRFRHACYEPVADYGLIVNVTSVEDKRTFDFYYTKVIEVLKFNKDVFVTEAASRVFAKRKHCKSQLKVGQIYLIMGKDGSTTDLKGQMVYLLDSNTWVEQQQSKEKCSSTQLRQYCKGFHDFRGQYQVDGCSQ